MRKALLGCVVVGIVIAALPAAGQTPAAKSIDDVIATTRDGFKEAKSRQEMERVALWCIDNINAATAREWNRLMASAAKLMEANKIQEGNALSARAASLKETTAKLAELVCRPE